MPCFLLTVFELLKYVFLTGFWDFVSLVVWTICCWKPKIKFVPPFLPRRRTNQGGRSFKKYMVRCFVFFSRFGPFSSLKPSCLVPLVYACHFYRYTWTGLQELGWFAGLETRIYWRTATWWWMLARFSTPAATDTTTTRGEPLQNRPSPEESRHEYDHHQNSVVLKWSSSVSIHMYTTITRYRLSICYHRQRWVSSDTIITRVQLFICDHHLRWATQMENHHRSRAVHLKLALYTRRPPEVTRTRGNSARSG